MIQVRGGAGAHQCGVGLEEGSDSSNIEVDVLSKANTGIWHPVIFCHFRQFP